MLSIHIYFGKHEFRKIAQNFDSELNACPTILFDSLLIGCHIQKNKLLSLVFLKICQILKFRIRLIELLRLNGFLLTITLWYSNNFDLHELHDSSERLPLVYASVN